MISGTATKSWAYSFSATPQDAKPSGAARGGAIAISSQIAKLALQLVQAAIMTRLLMADDFGLIAMSAAIMGLALFFTDLGLSSATVQSRTLTARMAGALFYVNIAAGIACLLVAWAIAPVMAHLFQDERLIGVIVISALGIPLYAAGAQHQALLLRDMRWGAINVIALIAQVIGLVVGVTLAVWFSAGYWALVAAGLVAATVSTGLAWAVTRWVPHWPGSLKPAADMLRFGGGMMMTQVLNWFHTSADDVLLGARGGAVQLGIYNRAYMLFILPRTLINGPLQSVYVPILSRLQDDPEAWKRTYLDALLVLTVLSAGLGAALVYGADPIITLIYGDRWDSVLPVFQVLAFSTFFATPAASCYWALVSLGRVRQLLIWQVVGSAVFLAAFVVAMPHGPIGMAWAYTIAGIILSPAFFVFLYFGLPEAFRPKWRDIAAVNLPFTAWTIAVLALFYTRDLFPVPDASISALAVNGLMLGGALGVGLVVCCLISSPARAQAMTLLSTLQRREA